MVLSERAGSSAVVRRSSRFLSSALSSCLFRNRDPGSAASAARLWEIASSITLRLLSSTATVRGSSSALRSAMIARSRAISRS
jgi:hypothetical protein